MEAITHAASFLYTTFVPFFVLLGILIFVHELGHFLVARWCGVRVETFSLGFGKKIFQYKKGDTVYALSIIPLGGYVKMFGDQIGEDISESEKKFAFTLKPLPQRVAIVSAGPLMNFIFAIAVFAMIGLIGTDVPQAVIGEVTPSSPAELAGMRSHDRILSADGVSVSSQDAFQKILNNNISKTIDLELQGADGSTTRKVKVNVGSVPNPNVLSLQEFIGQIEGVSWIAQGTIVGLKTDSKLSQLGMKTGSKITSVNDRAVRTWDDLSQAFKAASPNQALTIKFVDLEEDRINPNEKILTLGAGNFTPSLEGLGIEGSDLYIDKVIKDGPADIGGLKKGDRLISIAPADQNIQIRKWADFADNVQKFNGKDPLKITVLRDGELIHLTAKPEVKKQMTQQGVEESRFLIGVTAISNIADVLRTKKKSSGFFGAIADGARATTEYSVMTVLTFVRLFEGKLSPKNISGVISIGQAAKVTYEIGLVSFLHLMGLISVNLFVLNLLPIPVLDGGHLLFYSIEAMKGSPLSMAKMELAQQIGFALLIGLMIFALFNDFSRILGS